jgi:hypothetical protein
MHGSNQWASGDRISTGRLQTLVRYDLQKQGLLARKFAETGFRVPPHLSRRDHGSLQRRLALVRLDARKNPFTSDSRYKVIYWGLHAVWRYSDLGWRRRVLLSIWFLWVGLSPLPVAKLGVTWLFARQSRPVILHWLRKNSRLGSNLVRSGWAPGLREFRRLSLRYLTLLSRGSSRDDA